MVDYERLKETLNKKFKEAEEDFNTWFDRFLEEKELSPEAWEITGSDGEINQISSEVVIEAIKNAPPNEQRGIKDMIVKIDFANGDVNDYFKHLAKALVEQRILGRESLECSEAYGTN